MLSLLFRLSLFLPLKFLLNRIINEILWISSKSYDLVIAVLLYVDVRHSCPNNKKKKKNIIFYPNGEAKKVHKVVLNYPRALSSTFSGRNPVDGWAYRRQL